MDASEEGVLLDLDGTLVDSVYQHVRAWREVLREGGRDVPQWRIHRGVGMGSERLLPWLLGGEVEDAEVERLAARHGEAFEAMAETLAPTRGARRLVRDLERRGVRFAIATSASDRTRRTLLAALGREDLDGASADGVDSPKPAPDLVLAGAAELDLDPRRVTLVGDSPWDGEAARRAGARFVAVRCGGFGDGLLRRAGAEWVEDDPLGFVGRL